MMRLLKIRLFSQRLLKVARAVEARKHDFIEKRISPHEKAANFGLEPIFDKK